MSDAWSYVGLVVTAIIMLCVGIYIGQQTPIYSNVELEDNEYNVAFIELWDVTNGTYSFSKVLENPVNHTLNLAFSVDPFAVVNCSYNQLGPFEVALADFVLTVDSVGPQNFVVGVVGEKLET